MMKSWDHGVSVVKVAFARGLARALPERQIYYRCRGQVQFFVLSQRLQAYIVGAAFLAAAWVGIASANLMLEDRVVAEKEAEIARMATAYRDLDKELQDLRRGVIAKTDQLAERQKYLNSLIADSAASPGEADQPAAPATGSATIKTATPAAAKALKTSQGNTLGRKFRNLAALVIERNIVPPRLRIPALDGQLAVARQDLTAIDSDQQKMTAMVLAETVSEIDALEDVIRVTGLSGDSILSAGDYQGGQGGPFVGLGNEGESAPRRNLSSDNFYQLVAGLQRLEGLQEALKSVPLAIPVDHYYIASSFGARTDPLNHRRARHPGLDMSGPWKEPIYATADGIVVAADWNGPYGRMVEIDHGFGFKTRYGHLERILVKKGQSVSRRQKIGLMGASGRTTGTHVHTRSGSMANFRIPQNS